MGVVCMKFLGFIIKHIVPIGIIVGAGFLIYNAAHPPSSSRIDGLGVDLMSSPPLSAEAAEVDLAAVQQAGAEYVSIEVNWTLIETTQDVYNWSNVVPLDLFFTSANARGLKSVAVITGYPSYLAESAGAADQSALGARWEKFIQAAVDHFGDQVDYWQIGDQVNSTLASRSLAEADPGFYAKMLRSASKIIKRTDSNDKVWMGSLVSATAENCAVNPLTFLLEINGAKGLSALDAITYQPRRGAAAPEFAAELQVNEACASSMTVDSSTLGTEVQSVQDLARQLGGKTVYVTGLVWSPDELLALQAGRSIDTATLQSDLLVRGSTMLLGGNSVPLVLWQIDPLYQPNAFHSLSNMNVVLMDAKTLGQTQGQSGTVQEYRFQKGATLGMFAWRTIQGDVAQSVILTDLSGSSMTAFSSDSSGLDAESGTAIKVDTSGTSVVMLNERPVIFTGKTGKWDAQIQGLVKDQLDLWRIDLQDTVAGWLNHLKSILLQWLEDLFDQAKDSVVDWGASKVKDFLN